MNFIEMSKRNVKLKNYNKLIGEFDEGDKCERLYRIVEKGFDLKKCYSERDWLTQNRQEVP